MFLRYNKTYWLAVQLIAASFYMTRVKQVPSAKSFWKCAQTH